jgi:hypothetical protein
MSNLNDGTTDYFSDTILLQCVWSISEMYNPLSFEKSSKLSWTIFPTIVNFEHFYPFPNLCFDKAFEFLKLFKTFLYIVINS